MRIFKEQMKLINFNFFRNSFSIWKCYFQRFMRLTPSLIVVIFLNQTFLPLISNGLSSCEFDKNIWIKPCQDYWWSAAMHIQNFVNINRICLLTTWYLSLDWQLYLMTPVFTFILWKFKHQGVKMLSIFIVFFIFNAFKDIFDAEIRIRDIKL